MSISKGNRYSNWKGILNCFRKKLIVILVMFLLICISFTYLSQNNVIAADSTDTYTGTITSLDDNPPDETDDKAFDNDTGTKWLDFNKDSWIQYKYNDGIKCKVTSYSITSANDYDERDPRNWTLLGSNNNGYSWIILDTRKNEYFSQRFQKRTFTVENPNQYNLYRFNITKVRDNSHANSVQLSEIELEIDETAPTTPTISASPSSGPTNDNVEITINYTNNSNVSAANKQYRLDGGDWTRYNYKFSVSQNTFIEARAIDNTGNISTIASLDVNYIDNTAPTVPIIDLGTYTENTWINRNVTVTIGNSSDASGIDQYEYKIDDWSWTDYSSLLTISTEGTKTLLARAVDNAGNVSANSTTSTIKIDKTAPTATLSQAATTPTTATVTAVVSDDSSGVALVKYLPGTRTISDFAAAGTDITTSKAFMVYENGSYTVYVKDAAENEKIGTILVNSIMSELSYTEGEFIESDNNNGSINTVMYVTLSSGKFATSSTFVRNTHYQLSNSMPAGLNFIVSRENDTTLKLSFSGKATNHEAVNSLLTKITFTSSAFNSGTLPDNNQHNLTIRFFDRPQISVEAGAFTESLLNDGSIAGTKTLILTGAKFATNGITNSVMVKDTHYQITGVPAGLSATVTRESDTRLKLELTGTATSHASTNSISNLRLTLLPAAFKTSLSVSGNVNTFTVNFIDNRKIRVLEVYPSKIFDSGTQGGGDYKDAASLLSADYDVTSMSMNRFISLVDDVNGNYDVVYFGRGIYSNGGPHDVYYGNDITNLAADKVKELIEGGLLCIFHDTSLMNKMTNMTGVNVRTKMYENFNPYFNVPGTYPNVVRITNHTQLPSILATNLASVTLNKRPVLSVYEKPFSYRDLNMPLDNNNIEFKFISSDVEDSTLQAQLFLDRNNDGLFQEGTEIVNTLTVKSGKGDTFYYTMPTGLTGVYFWKLVVKDSVGAKNEITDVFYLKGDPITVNVLQVYPPDNNLDLSKKLNNAIASQPADSLGYRYGEYKINITTVSIDDFNDVPDPNDDPKFLGSLNGHYNMIIFGFYDNYSNKDLSNNAVSRLESFIETKQSVMFTHDMIADGGGLPKIAAAFKDDVGQTSKTSAPQIARYAVNSWNFTNSLFTGYNMNNGLDIARKIAMGGYTLFLPDGPDGVSTLNSNFPNYRDVTTVKNINSTAMTLYPFNIESTPQSSMLVAKTHNQYFKLDLEDPDLIPVFSLYREGAGERFNDDAMNNYYTYSKGNITYSGTGHVKADQDHANYPNFELQMFVNTMLKAYASSNHAPTINISKPMPNSKVEMEESEFVLEFTAYDYDKGDEDLNYKIQLDIDNDGIYEDYIEVSPIKSGVLALTEITKGFTDMRAFRCKVIVWDKHNAKAESEILLYNIDTPKVVPEAITEPDNEDIYFVGETINWHTKLTPYGKVITDMEIQPELTTVIPKNVEYRGETLTEEYTETNSSIPAFQFNETGPLNDPVNTAPDSMIAPNIPCTIYLKTMTNYSIDGKPEMNEHSKKIEVKVGKTTVHVVDTNGSDIDGVAVLYDGNATGLITEYGGKQSLHPVSRGDHEFSITIPDGYFLVKVEVAEDAEGVDRPYTTVAGSHAPITISTGAPSWKVKFTVGLAIDIPITYYKILPDYNVQKMDFVDDKYDLRAKKDSIVRIAALVDIPEIQLNNVIGIDFDLITTPDTAHADYTASINDLVTAFEFAETTETQDLRDANSRLAANNTTPPNGTYAGNKFYVIIEIKANAQSFGISQINLEMSNNTLEKIYNSVINIKELIIPKLR